MLSILYLLLEGVAVILPILLAVAFILILQCLGESCVKVVRWSFLILFLFILINIYLLIILSSIEQIYIFISNFAFNAINIIIKIWFNFLSYCNAIFIYSFTSNWPSNFLSVILPVGTKVVARTNYSTKTWNGAPKINPWFITGFTDGEGSFSFSLVESKTKLIGWNIIIHFNLVAKNNPANLAMFNSIVDFFGVGQVVLTDNYIRFIVNGLPNCLIIKNHFINFPLLSYKLVHFQLWCTVIDLLVAKEHLTLSGLLKIIALKAHSPNGLSEKLILAFPNYTTINCPIYNPDFKLINIHWLAGFINADGSFGLHVQKNKTNRGLCRFRIIITQHIRSLSLMHAIADFLSEGKVYVDSGSISTFKISDIKGVNTFISKFEEAQLMGAKALDYSDFCKAIDLINSKAHLTEKGFALFLSITASMNSTRTNFSYDSASK